LYSVIVTNGAGTVISSNATLAVLPVPASISMSGGRVRLTWIAELGRTYQVLCSDGLTNAAWTELNNVQIISPPIGSIEDTVINPQKFYRVFEK